MATQQTYEALAKTDIKFIAKLPTLRGIYPNQIVEHQVVYQYTNQQGQVEYGNLGYFNTQEEAQQAANARNALIESIRHNNK